LALRSLCSRDPSTLTEDELLAGTVESLAENASDSFVAPLFYYVLLGVPGAIGYRAVNTLDAMIGYRGKLETLGKFAARLDDVANWIPARLTALLFLLVGRLFGGDVSQGWRILRRDGGKTPSPNGGRPMAAMAGLLGVCLDKAGVYSLGDARHALTGEVARRAWHVVAVAGLSWVIACGLVLGACYSYGV
jgi:adenosylcobinamide-phosphate synthase